jgi:hypothetical protein
LVVLGKVGIGVGVSVVPGVTTVVSGLTTVIPVPQPSWHTGDDTIVAPEQSTTGLPTIVAPEQSV